VEQIFEWHKVLSPNLILKDIVVTNYVLLLSLIYYLNLVKKFALPDHPESYASRSLSTCCVTHARQVGGQGPDKR
jgi:hypothetical protein